MKDFDINQVLKAIEGSRGIVNEVAKKLGCNWRTAKRYIENWLTTKQAFTDETEILIDTAESKLFEALDNGDLWAIKFILTTKGRVRGYEDKSKDNIPEKVDLSEIAKLLSNSYEIQESPNCLLISN
ncbi:hypothetical protein JW960_21640 [candidate division KSB1 bacterium]|nr:hypothetical protein [candidate division KSB1 bacterium]